MGAKDQGRSGTDSSGSAAPPKRSHKSKGVGRLGGRRPGAGRPLGSKNTLPQGAVGALRALRHRVPAGTPEPLAELAGEALETVAGVMRGQYRFGGYERLNAARTVREEICGKVAEKHDHSGVVLLVIDPYAEPPAAAHPDRTVPPPPATADENQAADGGAPGDAA